MSVRAATDGAAYRSPRIEDYGSLGQLTADVEVSFEIVRSVAMLAQVSAPIVLPGMEGGAPQPPVAPTELGTPDQGGTLGAVDQGGSGGSGDGGTSPGDSQDVAGDRDAGRTADDVSGGESAGAPGETSGAGSGAGPTGSGGGGELPFTGLALGFIAGIGMILSLAGTWLRQRFRRV